MRVKVITKHVIYDSKTNGLLINRMFATALAATKFKKKHNIDLKLYPTIRLTIKVPVYEQ